MAHLFPAADGRGHVMHAALALQTLDNRLDVRLTRRVALQGTCYNSSNTHIDQLTYRQAA